MIAKIFLSLLLCSSFNTNYFSSSLPTEQQRPGDRLALWEPKFDFDNELFPSFVLSLSGRPRQPANMRGYFGDPMGLAEVWIRPQISNAQVHVEVQIEGFTSLSAIDVTLPDANQQYRIAPLLHYDFARLVEVDQSLPAIVTYTVRVNDVDLGKQSLPIRVCSVNDVPFESVSLEGKQQEFSFLFAGYVNESHPFVDDILKEALKYKAVNAFTGYQSAPEQVRLQVFAIWNVLQRRHFHYSNIATPSAASASGHVFSQAVRFIDQSIHSEQANCADGSVLFASILFKIGIQPVLVLKPGHMFVGYYLDQAHRQVEFLETTLIGAGHQPGSSNIAFSPILHPVQASESWAQFVGAIKYATNMYLQEIVPALSQHQAHYLLIDILKARQAGINAIPRPEKK